MNKQLQCQTEALEMEIFRQIPVSGIFWKQKQLNVQSLEKLAIKVEQMESIKQEEKLIENLE